MKAFFRKTIIAVILATTAISSLFSYVAKYKEDYYRLYHIHHQQLSDDCLENIYWLEQAVKADFCNPQYAYIKIENEDQWEKYRYLFMMHVNLKLIEQFLRLGRIYDKKVAYFYDAPWKDEYLRDLDKARSCYASGYYYWNEACLWAEKANTGKFKWMNLEQIQNWEDERERINTGDLDYKAMLDREIKRVDSVIAKFSEMEDEKY